MVVDIAALHLQFNVIDHDVLLRVRRPTNDQHIPQYGLTLRREQRVEARTDEILLRATRQLVHGLVTVENDTRAIHRNEQARCILIHLMVHDLRLYQCFGLLVLPLHHCDLLHVLTDTDHEQHGTDETDDGTDRVAPNRLIRLEVCRPTGSQAQHAHHGRQDVQGGHEQWYGPVGAGDEREVHRCRLLLNKAGEPHGRLHAQQVVRVQGHETQVEGPEQMDVKCMERWSMFIFVIAPIVIIVTMTPPL